MSQHAQLQAFLYRVATANTAVRALAEEGALRESPSETAEAGNSTLEFFGLEERRAARRMGRTYELLYCFENSVRELIETTLRDTLEETWWERGVPETIRNKAESHRRDDAKPDGMGTEESLFSTSSTSLNSVRSSSNGGATSRTYSATRTG